MRTKAILALALAIGCSAAVSAQSRKALRINEVMVENVTSVVDDYGNRSAWIELFNSNFGPLEISKVYITDDPSNPTKYSVPLGNVNTDIPRRQHVVFYADGQPERGTFHTNLHLVPGRDNYIALYDADGKTLIDEVVVPGTLLPDQSYARTSDGADEWEVRYGTPSSYVTPSSANIISEGNSKAAFFAHQDGHGFGLTVIAMGIVFSALLLVCICFYIISAIGAKAQARRRREAAGALGVVEGTDVASKDGHDSGEEIAAIVMALHEHLNVHDRESAIITLTKTKKSYSPWSSKIYNMRSIR